MLYCFFFLHISSYRNVSSYFQHAQKVITAKPAKKRAVTVMEEMQIVTERTESVVKGAQLAGRGVHATQV